jgi:hypothetical protein
LDPDPLLLNKLNFGEIFFSVEGEGEGVTKDEGGELGTARSISETSSTAPCATFVDPFLEKGSFRLKKFDSPPSI